MKKKKYKRFTKDLYLDDCLISLLENEAMNGWFLSSINPFNITFIKDKPRQIKYQIDYNQSNKEYDEIKENLGYQVVCPFTDIDVMIYKNDNINAPDLQTDKTTQLLSMISCFSLTKVIKNIIMFLLILLYFYTDYKSLNVIFHYSLASFFTYTKFYLGLLTDFSLALSYFIKAIFIITIHRYYKKQLNNPYQDIQLNTRLLKGCQYIEAIIHSLFLLFFLYILPIPTYLIILLYLSIIIIIWIIRLYQSHQHYQFILLITLFSIIVINLSLSQSQILKISPIEKPLYYKNQVNDNFIYENQDLFANSQSIQYSDKYYERFVKCLNENIAKIVYKDEIVFVDREYRKNKIINEYQKLGKEYNENDYPYLSFEESIQHMKVYQTDFVDECYYNEKYVVCIKDNLVLSFQIQEDKNAIDNIIKYYF